MRIVGWNIRAGGGRRVAALAAQIARWTPDVVALSEFRGTPPSAHAGARARRPGSHASATHGRSAGACEREQPPGGLALAAPPHPATVTRRASRAVAARGRRGAAPVRARRHARAQPRHRSEVGASSTPSLKVAQRWQRGPGALFLGDTNSGRPVLDEEVPGLQRARGRLDRRASIARDWCDAFRHLRGEERAYTWYSPNGGNGFRIDQAFLNPALLGRLTAVRYEWGRRRAGTARTSDPFRSRRVARRSGGSLARVSCATRTRGPATSATPSP